MAKMKVLEAQLIELKAKVNATASSAKPADKKKPAAPADQKPLATTDDGSKKAVTQKASSKAITKTLAELKDDDVALKDIATAFDVPDSPAAAVVGLPQEKVQHLRTAKQLGAAVISGVDQKGHFQSGLSVDFAPAQLLWKDRKIGEFRYRGGAEFGENLPIWWKRVAVRTQISLAATKGTKEGDKSSKLALGIHSVLANSDDALTGAYGEKHYTGENGEYVVTGPDGYPLDYEGRSLNWWVRSHEATEKRERPFLGDEMWYRALNFFYEHASWAVGAAPLWISQDGDNSYEHSGTTAWSSFAITPSAELPAQFLLDVVYKNAESVGAADAIGGAAALAAAFGGTAPKLLEQDSLFVTLGVRVGTRDFNATLTAAYLQLDQGALGTDEAFRYGIALEKRISDNSWLTLSYSTDDGHSNGKNESMVLGGVKVGLGPRELGKEGQKAKAIAR